jgi:uncharacterized protein
MKMALDNASGVNTIRSYEPGRVQIRERHFTSSLIVLPKQLLTDWQPRRAEQLRAVDFQPILALDQHPEIVILGTGETQEFPDMGVFATLMDLCIGFEVMNNGAACRTYNILLAEDRRAALALILSDEAH